MVIDPQVLLGLGRLRCEQIIVEPVQIIMHVRPVAARATCPVCGQMSSRIHSHCDRRVADLPWHGTPVALHIVARKSFCDTPTCSQRIFVERLDHLAAAYARKTFRLIESLQHIGFSLGGEAGSRLAMHLGMPASGDTLLRFIRAATPSCESVCTSAIGIDDWAYRRGWRYGTLVCDLIDHRPIEVLPDRDSHHVATWLRSHPELRIVSRDRGSEYIHAANEGAPQTLQVADRWHIMHNLRETLERILDGRRREIRCALMNSLPAQVSNENGSPLADSSDHRDDESHEPMAGSPQFSSRREQYDRVRELHWQGRSIRSIARDVGLYRGTVARYLRIDEFPHRAYRCYSRRTDTFIESIRRLWLANDHNAAHIFRELQSAGFTGSYCAVRRRVAAWRHPTHERPPPSMHCPSSRCISGWLVMNPQNRTVETQHVLDVLQQQCPTVRTIVPLAEMFSEAVRRRDVDTFDTWLNRVQITNVPNGLKRFARGLRADPAVRTALTVAWSNGPVEGQINRLKLIKRQMYGRAGFALLR
jgi:transposase